MASAWRTQLRPASFRGAEFHVEAGSQNSGRRTVGHEYPKRDTPYAEDMGRRARAFSVTAYVIGSDYLSSRDTLIAAMETEGPGLLVHPTMGEFLVNPGVYSCTETRLRGGMAEFELQFMEAGTEPNSAPVNDTASQVQTQADKTGASAAATADNELIST